VTDRVGEKKATMDMDRFFNSQNLDRLRSLASIATTEVERKILFGLLAEERLIYRVTRRPARPQLDSSRVTTLETVAAPGSSDLVK
jgi:hypothetical protein